MEEKELQEAYLNLVNHRNFDRLELALKQPNIFTILSVQNTEIRHSNFLGWLLNPQESHGLGNYFIKRFLREVFNDDKAAKIRPLDVETLDYQNVRIRREWQNIDLLILFTNLVICIENKVHAKDDGKQLTTYKNVVENNFKRKGIEPIYVFLTPFGHASSHEKDKYIFVSYRPVVQILEQVLSVYENSLSPQVAFYLRDYVTSIKRNLMGTDITNKLAKEIYLNHKNLLDFIYENKPDLLKEFFKYLKEYLTPHSIQIGSTGKGFVRFVPSSIAPQIPLYKNAKFGWSNKEAFLFEFRFDNTGKDNITNLVFKPTFSPALNNPKFRNRMIKILGEEGMNRDEDVRSWYSPIREEIEIDIAKILRKEPKEVEKFDNFWRYKAYPIIKKIETVMLAHKDELIALKQEVEKQ